MQATPVIMSCDVRRLTANDVEVIRQEAVVVFCRIPSFTLTD
jgi:hypothetical protein